MCDETAPVLFPMVGDASLRTVKLPFTAPEAARRLAGLGGLVWLDSSDEDGTGHSILTAAPLEVLRGSIHRPPDWEKVRAHVSQAGVDSADPGAGLFGWVGYEGDFVLGVYPHALILDHRTGLWFAQGDLDRQLAELKTSECGPLPDIHFRPQIHRAAFLDSIHRAREYIAAGDIYQVNLAYPWEADWSKDADPMTLYERLRSVSPAPHSAFIDLDDTRILSTSPETYLRMRGRHISTRPIKGTRPRFLDDPKRDAAARSELFASDKERAELLMITDLERNDLGRVCEFGSIRVPELWRIESFAQVHHFVSTVEGRLRPEVDHAEAFRACFPGGSITGAPKKRAMEIIAELEPHPRGIYTGAIGYFGFNGESQWNIAIRTVVQTGDRLSFHVGSGIVADSVPEHEHEETLHKAAGILAAARQG